MKPSTLLIAIALAPFGCGPAPQNGPPPRRPAADPASARMAEKAASAPAARVRLIIPAGTLLPIQIETTASSANSKEGDPVLAVLTEDVPLSGFKLDKGAEVRGHVRTAIAAKRVKGQARLVVAFDTVMENGEKLAITTEALDNVAASTGGKDKKIIAGSAAGGLLIGAIAGGTKGALIGTAAGAAAGTGTVLIMKGGEVEIPRGARLTLAVTK